MSPLHIKLSPSRSLIGVIPISTNPSETTAVVSYSSNSSTKSQQSEEATTISSSMLEKGGQPVCVTIDEEESQEQKTSPLPPGIASLPKTPPTVPIQFMFQLCCYCLVLMATPEYLVQHVIREHSHCQFQCRYCLYRAFTKIYMGVHLVRSSML
ncbi:hypothetical protein E2C01_045493 [Portunus trituberculatus]|uniref:C2H2-type domain-containing protein n=1 Tax=Portunus trituberculatus TaxID=210409 RepID=A0A5B7FYI4_PORTR|nr:hypothetical protein [Portunus trituberculatus]